MGCDVMPACVCIDHIEFTVFSETVIPRYVMKGPHHDYLGTTLLNHTLRRLGSKSGRSKSLCDLSATSPCTHTSTIM